MASIVEESTRKLADVVESLGNVPLARILADPAPGTAVEDDVARLAESSKKQLCELIDRVLVEKDIGFIESRLAIVLARWLDEFAEANNLGIVLGADGLVRLFPGQVRIPDVAFYSWDRLPERKTPQSPLAPVPPDLAIELLSPGNTSGEMERKRRDYFSSGVRVVWEIEWRDRSAKIWTSIDDFIPLTDADSLDGRDVLPGFVVPISKLFAVADRHG